MRPRKLLEGLNRALPRARRGVVVLAYHLVDGGTTSPVDISMTAFREQLALLKARFEVVRMDDVSRVAQEPARPVVVLTFDDAYANFYRVVWPVLVEFSLPAVLYVPVGFVEGTAPAPIRDTRLEPCTWTELATLARSGIEIGSHTVSHVNLRRAGPDRVERELRESRDILSDRLGVRVSSFCYPQAKWSRAAAAAVRRHYRTGVIAGGRRHMPARDDAALVPRFPVRRDLGDFAAMIESRVWLPEAMPDLVRQWIP